MPIIGNDDFSGGLNVRDAAHLLAPNEGTVVEGIDIKFKTVRTFPGDIRELIDITTYPEILDECGIPIPGTGGGVLGPILGRWRYYYGDGMTRLNDSWVRVWGVNNIEYWNPTTQRWVAMGGPLWTLRANYKPWCVQFQDGFYILHGNGAVASLGKYFWSNGAGGWVSGDIPLPAAPLAALRPTIAVPYKNRIYGCDQVNEPFRLRYSGVNLPQVWNSPQGGYAGIGEDRGDPIISMIVHKDNLFILKRSSMWRYWRDYYDNEYIEQVHGAAGCIAPQTACAYKEAICYASDEGMMAVYGADSDCVSHKIMRDVTPNPDYLWGMQAIVTAGGPEGGRLWVTYLTEEEEVQDYDACGTPVGDPYCVWHTDAWVADIRRKYILDPRWVKLPYYRLTNFAMPPHSNNYRGVDWQNLHFDAQQPDMNEWNPVPVVPDPLYPPGILGGPRHYSYRWNHGWDRDQVPAYDDLCGIEVYAGDDGVGFKMTFATPRYIPQGNMRRLMWKDMRLDYTIWRSADHNGIDGAWARIQIEGHYLLVNDPGMLDPTWWPITGQPVDLVVGGEAHQIFTLKNLEPSKGRSMKMEWYIVGTATRARSSHGVVFKYWGCEYVVPEDKLNPEV